MRQPQVTQRVSQTYSIPAPVGGWNARDAVSRMDEKDAVILTNFVPTPYNVVLRKGYVNYATGMSGNVEGLYVYNAGNTSKIFASVSSNVYDVTAGGAVGAAVVTGQSSARWQYVNFATAGGQFMYLVNGQDSPLLYDGTNWTPITAVSIPAITGVTTSLLINVTGFKYRLWFIEKNSMRSWYLPINSIGGAANSLDFSGLFTRGGYLVAMGDWTMDAGTGPDDYAIFITSEGEVAVYRGTDPSAAATWALVGVFYIGAPIGYRCMSKYASELLIITQDGLEPISKALASNRVSSAIAFTDKIQQAMSNAVTNYGSNFGWETTLYSNANLLLLNVPITNGTQQYVMSTITGSWCNFTGWNAYSMEVMKNQLYFGGTNVVAKAYFGNQDNGSSIPAEALQAFSYMETSSLKYFTEARPVISTDAASLGILLGLNVDFDTTAPMGTPTFSSTSASVWGTSLWGTGIWGGSLTIKKDWQTVGNIGYAASLHIKTQSSNANIQWSSTDYIFQPASGFV